MLKENGIKVDDESDEGDHGEQPNGHVANNCEVHVKNDQLETDAPEVIFFKTSTSCQENRNIKNIK